MGVLIRLFSYLLPLLGSNVLLGLVCGCGVIQSYDFVGSGRKGQGLMVLLLLIEGGRFCVGRCLVPDAGNRVGDCRG